MGATLLMLLRTAVTALAGWAVSDWFNERQSSKQAGQAAPSVGAVASAYWVKWIVIGLAVIVVGFVFALVFREKRKK